MKFSILAERIALKVGFLPLAEALTKGNASLIPEDPHLIWTGKKTQEGFNRKMIRDHQMRPEIVSVYLRPFAQITVNKKVTYVHRLVFDKVFGLPVRRRLKNLCGHTLCIKPHHWVLWDQPAPEIPEPPEFSDEWTLEDAIEILEMYLTTNTTLDRGHNYLVDMPEEFLRAGLSSLKKEHLL